MSADEKLPVKSDSGKNEIWFVKPLRFGGKVEPSNTVRVDRATHIKLVAFWNKLFLELTSKNK